MFEELVTALAVLDRDVSDADRVDQLTALERVKAACAAAQARVTADFAASQEQVAHEWRQRAQECADSSDFDGWVAAREQARQASVNEAADGRFTSSRRARRREAEFGVAGQVALARRESPSRGSQHLGMALALVHRLPRTLDALEVGAVSEWRAELVVRECAILTPEQQTLLDAELFDTLGVDGVGRLGDRELTRRVRAIAYRLDAESVMARARGAQGDRRVTIRPAPDTMCYLTAYLPVAQGVAVHAALVVAAATARAGGDERGKGQVMADTLVERVMGQATAAAVPVEVQVVITDRALFTNAFAPHPERSGETPAQIPGYGTVPAAWARDLIRPLYHDPADTVDNHAGERADDRPDDRPDAAMVWLRRLYVDPDDGSLVAMDSHRRTFTGGLRKFLIARDGTCTTPWCDAPIAHLDHIVPHTQGGPTTADNARGTCVRCNLTKEHPGWSAVVEPPDRPPGSVGRRRPRTVRLTTPTGHTYPSPAPPLLPGRPPPDLHPRGLLDLHYETLLAG